MEKSYYVISHTEGDIFKIEKELAAESGGSFIPDRACVSEDLMLESGTASIWNLTEEEVKELKQDARIKTIMLLEDEELQDDGEGFRKMPMRYNDGGVYYAFESEDDFINNPPTSKDDFIVDGVTNRQSAHFHWQSRKDWLTDANLDADVTYEGKFTGTYTGQLYDNLRINTDTNHYQANGEGIDIVVYDRCFGYHYNPEFDGPDGYRMKMVNWFEEAGYPADSPEVLAWDNEIFYADGKNDHGKCVAVAAAGKYGGWATGAHIYSVGVNIIVKDTQLVDWHQSRYLSLVLAWHKKKMSPTGNKRPTLLVSSVSSSNSVNGDLMPTRGRYRGTYWEYDGETREQLSFKYGIPYNKSEEHDTAFGGHFNSDNSGELSVSSYWMKELFDAGVPVVRSSLNSGVYMDLPADTINPVKDHYPEGSVGLDYDNYVVFENADTKYYYHRPNVPHFDGMVRCGELSIERYRDPEEGSLYHIDQEGRNTINANIEKVAGSSGNGPAVSLYSHTLNLVDRNYNKLTGEDQYFIYDEDDYYKILPIGIEDPEDWQSWDWRHLAHPALPALSRFNFNGTSAAGPNVAGIMACYMEKNPDLSPTEIHAKMLEDSPREANQGVIPVTDINLSGQARIKRKDPASFVSKVAYNPYWEKKAVDINGEINLHSSTYLSKSAIAADDNLLLITDIDTLLTQTTITVENDQMTTENNQTTVTLQVKDDNNVNVTTDDLVIDFLPSQGTVGEVVSEGAGVYSTTYFAPAAGSGSVEIKANIYGQEITEKATVFFQGTLTQEPPTLVTQTLNNSSYSLSDQVHYFSVLENIGENKAFARVTATSEYGPLSFAPLDSATATVEVQQNGNYCDVVYAPNPNYEAVTGANAGVRCTDVLGNFTDIDIVLQIINVDDNGPTFANGALHTASSIDEGTMDGSVVYTVVATDAPHDSAGPTITYSLPDQSALFVDAKNSNFFSINSSTGELTLTESVDYETHPSLVCVITATDQALNSSQQTVTFPINDVDENRPTFSGSAYGDDLLVNSGLNAVVYTAVASDANAITFTLDTFEGYNTSDFTINPSTGEVTLVSQFTEAGEVKIRVRATDVAGNFRFKDVTFIIRDESDITPPVVTSSNTATSITEHTGANQEVYSATFSDASGLVTWSLSDNSEDGLEINEHTGVVTLTEDPNFELNRKYEFTVIATDASGNSGSKIVTLNVLDIDDHAPNWDYPVEGRLYFESAVQFQAGEEVTEDTFLYKVVAEDDEGSTDGVITYQLHDPYDLWSNIEVNATTGDVFVKQGHIWQASNQQVTIDDNNVETHISEIRVRCSDASGNLSGTTKIKVGVLIQQAPNSVMEHYDVLVEEAFNPITDTSGEVKKVTYYVSEETLNIGDVATRGPVFAAQGDLTNVSEDGSEFTITNKNFSDNELRFETLIHGTKPTLMVYNDGINYNQQSTYEFRITYNELGKTSPEIVDIVFGIQPADIYPADVTVVQEPITFDRNSAPNVGTLVELSSNEPVTWSLIQGSGESEPVENQTKVTLRLQDSFDDYPTETTRPWIFIEPNGVNAVVGWFTGMVEGFTYANDTIEYTIVATDAFNNETFYNVVHNVTDGAAYTGPISQPTISGSTPHPFLVFPTLNVYENTASGSVLGQVSSTREDGTAHHVSDGVTYTIADNTKVGIRNGTELYLKEDYYDFENDATTNTVYITASTENDTQVTNLMLFTVDQNEAPYFLETAPNFKEFEITQRPAGTTVISNLSDYFADPEDETLTITVLPTDQSDKFVLGDDGNSVKANISFHDYVGVYPIPIIVGIMDSAGNQAERMFYIKVVVPPLEEKTVTGFSSGNMYYPGNHIGYSNSHSRNTYRPIQGTISPDESNAVVWNYATIRLIIRAQTEEFIWQSLSPTSNFGTSSWNRIVLSTPTGYETTLLLSEHDYFHSGTGMTWDLDQDQMDGLMHNNGSNTFTVRWYND